MQDSYNPQSELIEFLCRFGIGRKAVRLIVKRFKTFEALKEGTQENKDPIFTSLTKRSYRVLVKAFDHWGVPSKFPYFTYLDSLYPLSLQNLHDPPCALYYRGDLAILKKQGPWVGVVGTRYCSQYALKTCAQLVSSMRSYHPVIVSGMAMGVDGMAHQAALGEGIKTVGVLGTCIDQVYPLENAELFSQIEREGLLISELSPNAEMAPWRFPERNRIIAALADVLIVVEAPEKSGALLTAGHALELGKEVFIVPGPFDSLKNIGGHQLVQQGANLLIRIEEIFQSFKHVKVVSEKAEVFRPKSIPELSEEERSIFQILKAGAQHIDKVLDLSHLPPPLVSGLLMQLSLKGVIRELPGKFFEIS